MTMRTVERTERTEPQLALIRDLLRAIPAIRRARATITASGIEAFLLVAQKEGLSVGEYARQASLSVTTMSRHLLDLGERDRNYEEGAGLVEGRENPMNRREKLYFLTHKGRALLASIQRVQR